MMGALTCAVLFLATAVSSMQVRAHGPNYMRALAGRSKSGCCVHKKTTGDDGDESETTNGTFSFSASSSGDPAGTDGSDGSGGGVGGDDGPGGDGRPPGRGHCAERQPARCGEGVAFCGSDNIKAIAQEQRRIDLLRAQLAQPGARKGFALFDPVVAPDSGCSAEEARVSARRFFPLGRLVSFSTLVVCQELAALKSLSEIGRMRIDDTYRDYLDKICRALPASREEALRRGMLETQQFQADEFGPPAPIRKLPVRPPPGRCPMRLSLPVGPLPVAPEQAAQTHVLRSGRE